MKRDVMHKILPLVSIPTHISPIHAFTQYLLKNSADIITPAIIKFFFGGIYQQNLCVSLFCDCMLHAKLTSSASISSP